MIDLYIYHKYIVILHFIHVIVNCEFKLSSNMLLTRLNNWRENR